MRQGNIIGVNHKGLIMSFFRFILNTCFCLSILILIGGCHGRFVKSDCMSDSPKPLNISEYHEFKVITKSKCNSSGILIEEGSLYTFDISVLERIEDGRIKYNPAYNNMSVPLGPDGFDAKHLKWYERLIMAMGQPFRPIGSSNVNWFELIGVIGQDNEEYFSLFKYSRTGAFFRSPRSGELFCFVNDFPMKYCNNEGSFSIKVTLINKPNSVSNKNTSTNRLK